MVLGVVIRCAAFSYSAVAQLNSCKSVLPLHSNIGIPVSGATVFYIPDRYGVQVFLLVVYRQCAAGSPVDKGTDPTLNTHKLHFIRAGTIAAGNWYIQQTKKDAQLSPVVYDLAVGHTDDLSLA